MATTQIQHRYFLLGLFILSLSYFCFELYFNSQAMFTADEFWFAHRIYQYKDGIPYKDFPPYKTVLGYYVLLIPMLLSNGIINTLVFTKDAIALINTCVLFGCSIWLTRFFSRPAILTSLALIISSETVLSYSTNIRVDLIGYWFCLAALLFILDYRFILAGIMLGLGFITTQKAIWYVFAIDVAVSTYWLMTTRNKTLFMNLVKFNLATLLIIALYIIFWSCFAGWHTVIHNMFFEAAAMYQLDAYADSRELFWHIITLFNPLLLMLWPLTFISILVTYEHDDYYYQRVIVTLFAGTILICLMMYKQIFPYYMQVVIPIELVLYAAFFSWLFAIFNTGTKLSFLINQSYLWILCSLHFVVIATLINGLQLPNFYLFVCLIPFLFCGYLCQRVDVQRAIAIPFLSLISVIIIVFSVLSTYLFYTAEFEKNHRAYQQDNMLLANSLLQDGSDYVAGIEFIYNKSQSVAGMKHLMKPAVDYLFTPTPHLRTVMLASLDEDPNVTPESIILTMKKSAVKFYINNYRMVELPPKILHYLASEFEHFWGSIYLYSPMIASGRTDFSLKFSHRYHIEANNDVTIILNGQRYHGNTIIYLAKGHYTSRSSQAYRLRLIPDGSTAFLKKTDAVDDWRNMSK